MSESYMIKFVTDLFNSTSDLGTLTQKIVREKFLQHKGLQSLEKEEKAQLKLVVAELAQEYREKRSAKKSGGRKSSQDDEESEETGGSQVKRKHVSSVSTADSQEEGTNAAKPKKKRSKKSEKNGVDSPKNKVDSPKTGTSANKKIKPTSGIPKQSPKPDRKSSAKKNENSPRKSPKKKPPKARKRLSSGDVREAILNNNDEEVEKIISGVSSFSESESDAFESQNPNTSAKNRVLSKASAFEPSSASEYGSPLKDDTPVVKPKRTNNKSKKLVESDSELSETFIASDSLTSSDTSVDTPRKPIVKKGTKTELDINKKGEKSKMEASDCEMDMSDGQLNISDQKSVTVTYSYEGDEGEKIINTPDSDRIGGKRRKSLKSIKRNQWVSGKKSLVGGGKRKREELESDTDSELDDKPLKKKNDKKKASQSLSNTKDSDSDSDSDWDKPLKKLSKKTSELKKEDEAEDSPIMKVKPRNKPKVKKRKLESDSDMGTPVKKSNASQNAGSGKKTKVENDEQKTASSTEVPPSETETGDSSPRNVKVSKNGSRNSPMIKSKAELSDLSDDSSDESDKEDTVNLQQLKIQRIKKPEDMTNEIQTNGCDNSDSDDESLAQKKSKIQSSQADDTSDTPVHDSEGESRKKTQKNKSKQKTKKKPTTAISAEDAKKAGDSSDTSVHDSEDESTKKTQKNKTKQKTKKKSTTATNSGDAKKTTENKDPTKTTNVLRLEKILRYIQAMPVGKKYTAFFEGCDTARKREQKLKQLLVDSGMEGNPSMEKAEVLKLKKEAQQLNSDNILKESGRGKRRNVFSAFSSKGYVPPSPTKPIQVCTPIKEKFKGLKGIIDSEGSGSD